MKHSYVLVPNYSYSPIRFYFKCICGITSDPPLDWATADELGKLHTSKVMPESVRSYPHT